MGRIVLDKEDGGSHTPYVNFKYKHLSKLLVGVLGLVLGHEPGTDRVGRGGAR